MRDLPYDYTCSSTVECQHDVASENCSRSQRTRCPPPKRVRVSGFTWCVVCGNPAAGFERPLACAHAGVLNASTTPGQASQHFPERKIYIQQTTVVVPLSVLYDTTTDCCTVLLYHRTLHLPSKTRLCRYFHNDRVSGVGRWRLRTVVNNECACQEGSTGS